MSAQFESGPRNAEGAVGKGATFSFTLAEVSAEARTPAVWG
jgi:hypothetical protein